jgi:hypothetical protein
MINQTEQIDQEPQLLSLNLYTSAQASPVFQQQAPPNIIMSNAHTPATSNGGISSEIYSAVYSGVAVFEMMIKDVAVMRRRKDAFMNATQILKVGGIDKGKRTKILEKVSYLNHLIYSLGNPCRRA